MGHVQFLYLARAIFLIILTESKKRTSENWINIINGLKKIAMTAHASIL